MRPARAKLFKSSLINTKDQWFGKVFLLLTDNKTVNLTKRYLILSISMSVYIAMHDVACM